MRGRFVAFEGGEGAGKSTQAKMLAETLRARGYRVDVTREPGGTPGAEAIRSLLLDPPGDGWGAQAEALLFAAARADHVAQRIRPKLEQGIWVVCDRYVDSSRAYQGRAGGLGDEAITALHAFGSGGLRPDLTVLLEVDHAQAAQRLAARDGEQSDAIGGRSTAYHRDVAAAFHQLAAHDSAGIVAIDGNGAAADIHDRVIAALTELLEERK